MDSVIAQLHTLQGQYDAQMLHQRQKIMQMKLKTFQRKQIVEDYQLLVQKLQNRIHKKDKKIQSHRRFQRRGGD